MEAEWGNVRGKTWEFQDQDALRLSEETRKMVQRDLEVGGKLLFYKGLLTVSVRYFLSKQTSEGNTSTERDQAYFFWILWNKCMFFSWMDNQGLAMTSCLSGLMRIGLGVRCVRIEEMRLTPGPLFSALHFLLYWENRELVSFSSLVLTEIIAVNELLYIANC
jgi:hypothetical protein